jgi:Protein of unknown function (DUF2934)
MSKSSRNSSRNSIDRPATRPARRARRGAAAAEARAEPAVVVETADAADTVATPEAAPAASSHDQVAQLAFHYFADSGYAHGHALDHWLRAEHELAGS